MSEEHRKKCALGRKGIPSYNRGQVEVNNQIEYLFVNKEDVQTYLDKGYVLGGRPHVNGDHRKGKIAVNKDNHTYFINPSELDIYLLNGYQKVEYQGQKILQVLKDIGIIMVLKISC